MTHVSITSLKKAVGVNATPATGGFHENLFSVKLKLSEAGALLRNTSQHQKWKDLCQNNDEVVVKMADTIIERHAMLEKAQKGEPIDFALFDELTRELEKNEIYLFKSEDIFSKKNNLTKTNRENAESINGASPSDNLLNQLEELNLSKPTGINQLTVQTPVTDEPEPSKLSKQKEELTLPKEPVAEPATSVNPNSNEINDQFSLSDDYFVLINAVYKNFLLGNGLAGYGDSKNLFLSMESLLTALDFNIQTDGETGTAEGWFISEDRKFALDIKKNEVTVNGESQGFPPGGVEMVDGEIYIDKDLFSKWFPVDFHYDYSQQSVAVKPREQLPIQARLEREQSRDQLRPRVDQGTLFPREKSEYEWLEVPFVDFEISNSYTPQKKKDQFDTKVKIHATGDIGKMTSELDLEISGSQKLEEAKFSLKRVDPDGTLLGPLKATAIEIGDITSAYVPGASVSRDERGIKISNKELFRSNEFDPTFFYGELPPDWDIELYRNGVLIDSARVGADGEYEFADIQTYYGKNDFKLISYGPQGQKKVETQSINIGSDLLKVGQSEYNLSLTQKGTEVYDDLDDNFTTQDKDTLKFNASYERGVSPNLTLGGGISRQEIREDVHNLLNVNAKGRVKNISLQGDLLHDTYGGNGFTARARTSINDVDLDLQHQFYDDFLTKNYSQTQLSLNKVFTGKSFLQDVVGGLSFKRTAYDDYNTTSIGSRLSTNIKGVNLRNYLTWVDADAPNDDLSGISGSFNADTSLKKFRLSGHIGYDIEPEPKITEVSLSNSFPITDRLSSNLYVKQNFETDDSLEGSLGFNWTWNNGKYILSPKISHDSDGETTAGLTFSTSFGRNPSSKKMHMYSKDMADRGKLSVKVYHDKNNNAEFDKDDEVIKGALVEAVQSREKAKTDEDGIAFLPRLQEYKPTDIVLDKTTLEDPFWEPSKPGRSIIPRPGHVQTMEIPVVAAGEVDGSIFMATEDGLSEPLSNVKIRLIDSSGKIVQEVYSEYDGFYYFSKVFPGKYSVEIDPDNKKCAGLTKEPILVEIGNDGNIESGMNFFLEKAAPMIAKEGAPSVAEEDKTKKISSKETLAASKSADAFHGKNLEKKAAISDLAPSAATVAENTMIAKEGAPSVTQRTQAIEKTASKDMSHASAFSEIPDQKTLEARNPSDVTESPVINLVSPKPVADVSVKPQSPGEPKYGLHLSSYRTADKAVAGINYLLKKYKGVLTQSDFTIKKVDVSEEKGVWYRVIAGASMETKQLETIKKKIKMQAPYCKIVSLEPGDSHMGKKGVHLTSFRRRVNAERSIKELKAQYPSLLKDEVFTIQDVDLGPQMGEWKRVVVGASDESGAKLLARKIKMKSPYAKVMKIENSNDVGIHMASYKTPEKAVNGLKILQKKYSRILKDEDFSIRSVDLGDKKGVWYRVFAGRFDGKQSAVPIQTLLKEKKQYARIMNF